ncbi:hypothetical protein [Oceaniglobus indicus]|uniref:hypothetical protein n=1 Tax=Oceaniglobus indicus TaxID=2047749 RepID=UPI001F4DD462|nr:hypothetical protein [Oceaniglobus indicus]
MTKPSLPVNSPLRRGFAVAIAAGLGVGPASAHTAQSGFVLLLPTDVYLIAGSLAVAATVIFVTVLPGATLARLFRPRRLGSLPDLSQLRAATSLIALGCLALLIVAGHLGPSDPLSNLLPLAIWTVWWICLVAVQGVFGDVWAWVNPWTGFQRLANGGGQPPLKLPAALGQWPAVVIFGLAMGFALADPAPDSPPRLAGFVAGYALFTLAGVTVFGARWLRQVECFTIMLRWFATLAPLQLRRWASIGFPGWASLRAPVPPVSGAVFIIVLLATGSFDGLNETFWWFARIGINPLAFPGRSEIIWDTTLGLIGANVLLVAAFWGCAALGVLLVRAFVADTAPSTTLAFRRLSVSLLPIALGYHIAHFFTAFLVNGQYALVALSDPLANGADLLNLGQFYVTTGFFNTRDTVQTIFRVQAGAIVIAHILGVLMAHRIADDLFTTRRAALLGQIPLALFMVLYTLLGLWLLAAPRGA